MENVLIMKIVGVLSIALYFYSMYCIVKEYLKSHKKDNNITLKHRKVHSAILMYLFLFSIVLLWWICCRHGIIEGFYLDIIKHNFWLILVLHSWSVCSITRHFRKERINEDFLFNPKQEIKKTITFDFKKVSEFEILIKKFVEKQKKKGKIVEVITDFKNNLEPFKYLKKGQLTKVTNHTWLEKATDKIEHNYLYHNKSIVIFSLHKHIKLIEEITAIDYDINLYFLKNKILTKVIVKIGESYTIPKNINHGVIFNKIGKIGLKWK